MPRKLGQIDRHPRRLRLPPEIRAELEARLGVLIDELVRTAADVEGRPLLHAVERLEASVIALTDHLAHCRGFLK